MQGAGAQEPASGIPAAEEQPQVLYRVPAHAAWFKYNQIHMNEVKGIPEYFNSQSPQKTPRVSELRVPQASSKACGQY